MAIAEIFTKRHIVDIKESDDTIDKEYYYRRDQIRSTTMLRDFLRDYEEFLPKGFQAFRNASDETCQELIKQVQRVREFAAKGRWNIEPTEAVMFYAPPMITQPRAMAMSLEKDERAKGRKVHYTWGQAFLRLSIEGVVEKLIQTQERAYRRVIEIKEQISEMVDTSYMPGDPGDPAKNQNQGSQVEVNVNMENGEKKK